MEATSSVPDRPGKTEVWTASRAPGRYDARRDAPSSTQPPSPGIRSLDALRLVFWEAYKHLFPPHSLAAQMPNGNVVISWSVMDEPNARYPYAAPVVLRLDDALVAGMARMDAAQRLRVAQRHEPVLREGLRGYDPFARFPNARVITLG